MEYYLITDCMSSFRFEINRSDAKTYDQLIETYFNPSNYRPFYYPFKNRSFSDHRLKRYKLGRRKYINIITKKIKRLESGQILFCGTNYQLNIECCPFCIVAIDHNRDEFNIDNYDQFMKYWFNNQSPILYRQGSPTPFRKAG